MSDAVDACGQTLETAQQARLARLHAGPPKVLQTSRHTVLQRLSADTLEMA